MKVSVPRGLRLLSVADLLYYGGAEEWPDGMRPMTGNAWVKGEGVFEKAQVLISADLDEKGPTYGSIVSVTLGDGTHYYRSYSTRSRGLRACTGLLSHTKRNPLNLSRLSNWEKAGV